MEPVPCSVTFQPPSSPGNNRPSTVCLKLHMWKCRECWENTPLCLNFHCRSQGRTAGASASLWAPWLSRPASPCFIRQEVLPNDGLKNTGSWYEHAWNSIIVHPSPSPPCRNKAVLCIAPKQQNNTLMIWMLLTYVVLRPHNVFLECTQKVEPMLKIDVTDVWAQCWCSSTSAQRRAHWAYRKNTGGEQKRWRKIW